MSMYGEGFISDEEIESVVEGLTQIDEPITIILTSEEMVSIALANEIISSISKDIEICSLKLQQLELSKHLLDIKKSDDNNRFEEAKVKGKRYLASINDKYGIPTDQKWGYNPQTGEVIINNENS